MERNKWKWDKLLWDKDSYSKEENNWSKVKFRRKIKLKLLLKNYWNSWMILIIKENKLFLMRKHFQLLTKNQKPHHYVMKEKFLINFNKFYNSSINRKQKNRLKRKKKFKMIYQGELKILMRILFKRYLMKQVLKSFNYMLSRLMK